MADVDDDCSDLLLNEMSRKGKGKMGLLSVENFRKCFFWATQVIGLIIIILTLVHIFNYRGGFGGREFPKQEFCWHVFFMTLGFTYFLANSLLAFRLLPILSKPKLKLIHMGLNTGVIICAFLGLAFVIDEREIQGKAHFQSLHSWLGISAIALLVIQGTWSAAVYLPAKVPTTIKQSLMSWHVKCGIAVFLLGTAAMLTGFKKGSTESEKLLLNFTGAFVVILCFLVLHLLSEQNYKFSFRIK